MKPASLSQAQLELLRGLSGSVVASSIESFHVRLSNTGFTDSSIRSMFDDRTPIVGYAATLRIRTSEPPMEGGDYYKGTRWWDHLLSVPEPRVVVIEDLDKLPGRGAFVGEVHASILVALGCVGLVTNGTVRDVDRIQPTGFRMFARGPSVSHAYAHVFEFGKKVTVSSMDVEPGDLIHGDRHGVQTIPLEIAARVPAVAEVVMRRRQQFVDLSRSPNFSLETLRQAIQETEENGK
jgi:4-hydroxy-4-methyl-2-oxoglutarate aldolase